MRRTSRFFGKIFFGGMALTILLLSNGCMAGQRTKACIYDAYYRYQLGDNPGALVLIKRAVRLAARPCVPGYVMVEAYDDAGLYYFLNEQPREAFIHQAVAVLLAEVIDTPVPMRKVYRDRLYMALAASDIGLQAAAIREDVHTLLSIPEVRDNPLIRRYYERDSQQLIK